MGYKNKAQYSSTVSGGSWFYGLYSFCQGNPKFTDALLLGESCGLVNGIPDPSKLTLSILNNTNKTNSLYYGHIFTNKDILNYAVEALTLPDIPMDSVYNYCIGKMVLDKYGLNGDGPVAASALHANDITKRNIFTDPPVVMPPNMPFWICNTTLFFNYVTQYPYTCIPMTPLYSGVPQIITRNNNTIGGYFVENFAFGNTDAPTDIQLSFSNPRCVEPYMTSLKKNRNVRTLRDMLGVSSMAVASVLYTPQDISSVLPYLLPSSSTELIPKYNIWGDTTPIPTISDSQCTSDLLKGGCKVPYGYDVDSCSRIGPQCYSLTTPQCKSNNDCTYSFSELQCVNKNKNNSSLSCKINPSFFSPFGCKCVSTPKYIPSNTKYLNNQNAKLSDGAFSDNTGIVSLLSRGVKKIISFVNGTSIVEEICDVTQLFGLSKDSCLPNGSMSLNTVKVFNSNDYTNKILPQFKSTYSNGGVTFAKATLNVLENTAFGVAGNYAVEILFIYLQPSAKFKNSLPNEIKKEIVDGGLFSNFPVYKTFLQNKNLGIVSLTLNQFNILSTYTDWCLNEPEIKAEIQKMFT